MRLGKKINAQNIGHVVNKRLNILYTRGHRGHKTLLLLLTDATAYMPAAGYPIET
jgi:hypothetical protein